MRLDKSYSWKVRIAYRKDLITQINRVRLALDMSILTKPEEELHILETLELELINLLKEASKPEVNLKNIKYHNYEGYTPRYSDISSKYIYKQKRGYNVNISYNGEKIYIGWTKDFKEAVKIRNKKLRKMGLWEIFFKHNKLKQ